MTLAIEISQQLSVQFSNFNVFVLLSVTSYAFDAVGVGWICTTLSFVSLKPLSVRSNDMADGSSIWLNERDKFLRLTELQRRLLLFNVGVCGCCCDPYDKCISSSYEKLPVSFDSEERSSCKWNDLRLFMLELDARVSDDVSSDRQFRSDDERSGVLRNNNDGEPFWSFCVWVRDFFIDGGVVAGSGSFEMGDIQPNDSRSIDFSEISSGERTSTWFEFNGVKNRRPRKPFMACWNLQNKSHIFSVNILKRVVHNYTHTHRKWNWQMWHQLW